jgi:hypothetical protein
MKTTIKEIYKWITSDDVVMTVSVIMCLLALETIYFIDTIKKEDMIIMLNTFMILPFMTVLNLLRR